jgi:hypothetical protein
VFADAQQGPSGLSHALSPAQGGFGLALGGAVAGIASFDREPRQELESPLKKPRSVLWKGSNRPSKSRRMWVRGIGWLNSARRAFRYFSADCSQRKQI